MATRCRHYQDTWKVSAVGLCGGTGAEGCGVAVADHAASQGVRGSVPEAGEHVPEGGAAVGAKGESTWGEQRSAAGR